MNHLVRLTQTKITTVAGINRDVLCQAGMDFQHPNPFLRSINDNVTHGPRLDGITRQQVDSLLLSLWIYPITLPRAGKLNLGGNIGPDASDLLLKHTDQDMDEAVNKTHAEKANARNKTWNIL